MRGQPWDDAAPPTPAGARNVVFTGNLKFDVVLPGEALTLGRELRARFGAQRAVWLAASTRDGEESLILDALAPASLPDGTLTVLVPRHPQRFAAVVALLEARRIPFIRRTDNRDVPVDPKTGEPRL